MIATPILTPVYQRLAEASYQLALAMAAVRGDTPQEIPELSVFAFRKAWESVADAAEILADNATYEAAASALAGLASPTPSEGVTP
jgi:hypothetical protein